MRGQTGADDTGAAEAAARLSAWSRLSTRLSLGLIVLVLATVAGAGLLIYRNLEASLLPARMDELQSTAETIATTLETYTSPARADVAVASGLPQLGAFLRARMAGGRDPVSGFDTEEARGWTSEALRALIEAHPEYLQLRLIGLEDGGRELIRVDRPASGSAARVVPEGELQRKEDRPYFTASAELAPGEFHVSSVELNEEHGAVATPHIPVLRVSKAVFAEGRRAGFVIVNVDMAPIFARIASAAPPDGHVLAAGEDGGFLVHPDAGRTFGRQLGAPHGLADDYPDLAPATGATATTAANAAGETDAIGMATARPAGPPITVVVTVPLATLDIVGRTVRRSGLAAASIAAAIAIALGILLAQSVARPVTQISSAVQSLGTGAPMPLPVRALGEIGVLARAFQRHIETEATFGAVFNSSEDAMLTAATDGRVTAWNPTAASLFGLDRSEALGAEVEACFAEEDRETIGSLVRRVLAGEPVRNFETLCQARDGRTFDASLTISPVRLPSGAIAGLSFTCRDITERKQAERRFRLAVEASPTGMVMVDGEGIVRLVNSECERLFGYDREELVGQPVELLVPLGARAGHKAEREHYMGDASLRSMGAGRDLFARRKDGSEFPVEIGLNPIATPDGPVVLGAIVDVSERKKAEALIAARTRDLERSNAELAQFANIASHDLREPLRMVTNYSQLLAERYRGQLDDRADRYIHYAVDGAQRMQQLIDDLLAYSRVGTQGKPLRPVDANAVLESVLRSLEVAIAEAGAEVESGPLPTVEADEVQLRQLFQNLIGNAVKFRSERAPRIRIDARIDGRECIISVTDNGIGMDMQNADRIFQMFQRLHDRNTFPGSGIGLAVAKKIVERHGGRIWFESRSGQGSTFYFTLRRANGAEAA